jgi:inosose dehydratase
MQLSIGNAPCSWGVEFANDPRNPPWQHVLNEVEAAGYRGIELGPVGYMPEDPAVLGPALAERGLSLIGGVVFQPFHDPAKWDAVLDTSRRTCMALRAHGTRRIVLVDSIAPRRASTAGRPNEAERMTGGALTNFLGRLRTVAEMARNEYGLEPTIHAHAGGYIDFEDELERVLDVIDPELLKVCLDTGHSVYAGFNPVDFYRRHADRVSYLHFKDISPTVKAKAIAERADYFKVCGYRVCGEGLFCRLGQGAVDFIAFKAALEEHGYSGWATVEQDCDPTGPTSPLDDAKFNLRYLEKVGLA